jgi:DNA-binding NarL/FixJ family response regulator
LKQTRGRALVEAIETVVRGESLLDPSVTRRVMERVRAANERKAADPLDTLNEQEKKILQLISEGKTNKEIASDVFLSDKTVKNYVSSILTKLNLRRRSEAAAFIARREPPSGT